MKRLLQMFLSFLKIGAFTFGGGYAMIPLIEEEVVNKNKWIDQEEFMDILVISQSLPGAISINCSTFIGYKIGGILGGIVGILGVTLPSFAIILAIAAIFIEFRHNYYVNLAFKGISSAVPMLVLYGVISISKGVEKNKANGILCVVGLIALVIFNVNPIIVILASALYGIIFLKEKVK